MIEYYLFVEEPLRAKFEKIQIQRQRQIQIQMQTQIQIQIVEKPVQARFEQSGLRKRDKSVGRGERQNPGNL